ncbi:MAG: Cdc6/Cdc18 family protein [Halobacteria archaeon]|nr:Cdc6/Cdc18 family protein [Halobacteria archaeon]
MVEDARVLQDEFIPREVVHRDTEVDLLSNSLEPAVEGEKPDDVLLFGPTGAGKTCISKYVLERLREEVLDVRYRYINCWRSYSRFSVLYEILEGIDATADIHRTSTPKDELLRRVKEYDGSPYVVVLDEVDQLEEESVLYDLYGHENISTIMIANEENELLAGMDDRVVSRLRSGRKVEFDGYSTHELKSILLDRVRWGLDRECIDEDTVEEIADSAAGDARVAIGSLRGAVRRAESADRNEVTREDVEKAVPETRENIREESLDRLNEDQEMIYSILKTSDGSMSMSDIYDEYEERVETGEVLTKRTVRSYLSKMEEYGLVESKGKGRGRTYSAVE